jgi:uroporphyrin-3 C-methyltransferase
MAKPDAQNSSSRGTTRTALVVVGVLALAGLAYAIARVDILRARIVTQEIAMNDVQRDNRALQVRLETLNLSNENNATQFNQLRSELATISDNFGDLHTRAEQAQRLVEHSETLYLLRLANSQLQLAHDPDSAIDTLSAVETILRSSSDAALSDIHQQVAAQLAQLRALPRSDVARIQQQLTAAEQQTSHLPLLTLTSSAADVELPTAGLSRAWTLLKRGLASLFVIRKTDAEINAALDADEQAMHRRHLQLLLISARQATHLYDQPGYVNALNDSVQWLDQAFDTGDATVSQLRAQLVTLAQQNIAPALPDLTPSIQALSRQAPAAKASAP